MSRYEKDYSDLKNSVDILTDIQSRYLPFRFKSVEEYVDGNIVKEELIYVGGIFLIVSLLLYIWAPKYVMKKEVSPYGVETETLDYRELFKWSVMFTFVGVVGIILYYRQ